MSNVTDGWRGFEHARTKEIHIDIDDAALCWGWERVKCEVADHSIPGKGSSAVHLF